MDEGTAAHTQPHQAGHSVGPGAAGTATSDPAAPDPEVLVRKNRSVELREARVTAKSGGRSGDWVRPAD